MPSRVTTFLLLASTVAATLGTLAILASIGTPFAWVLAGSCALFVTIGWAQAAAIRRRGAGEAARAIRWIVLLAVAVLLGFAVQLQDLADQAATQASTTTNHR